MKNSLKKLLMAVFGGVSALALGALLTACGAEPEHVHGDWTAWVVTKTPTCQHDGTLSRYCGSCGEQQDQAILKYGHNVVKDLAQAATCVIDGKTEGSHCSTCGEVFQAQQVITATHKLTTRVVGEIPAPSCKSEQSYETEEFCTVCEREISRKTVTVAQKEHTMSENYVEFRVEPTCVTDGVFRRTNNCKECGEELAKEETVIKATGHTVQLKEHVDPTCTASGKDVYACTRCGEVDRVEEITPLGHDIQKHTGKTATCLQDGWTDYETCTRCEFTTYQKLSALGHDYGEYTSNHDATCQKDGTMSAFCARCSKENTKTDVGSRTEHAWVLLRENDEEIVYKCKNCGQTVSNKKDPQPPQEGDPTEEPKPPVEPIDPVDPVDPVDPTDPTEPDKEQWVKIQTQNHRNNTEERHVITVLKNCALTIEYGVDSDEFDVVIITVKDFSDEIGGREVVRTLNVNLKAGDVIEFAYVKDESERDGTDQGYIIIYGLSEQDVKID